MSVLDKLRLRERSLALRRAWRTRWLLRWAIYAIPVILVLGLLSGALTFLSSLVNLVSRVIAPAFDSELGRLIAFNLAVILVVVFTWKRARRWLARLLGCRALQSYLSGLAAMARDEIPVAMSCFQRVVRIGKRVDLSLAVPEFPELRAAAHVKLALCHQIQGDAKESTYWAETTPAQDLPAAVARDRSAVRALAYAGTPELLPETVEKELRSALSSDRKNLRVLRTLRDRLEATRRYDEAAELQEAIVGTVSGDQQNAEKRRLAALLVRKARKLIREGSGRKARTVLRKACETAPDYPPPFLLAGDLEAERGRLDAALTLWGRCPSLPGLDRVQGVLARETGPALPESESRRVAASLPVTGTLLALGRAALVAGDAARAGRAARVLLDRGVEHAAVYRLLGDAARTGGDEEAARRAYLLGLRALWKR